MNNPFKDLDKKLFPQEKQKKKGPAAPPHRGKQTKVKKPAPSLNDTTDAELFNEADVTAFSRAMQGVKPIETGGRSVQPKLPPAQETIDDEDDVRRSLEDLVDGRTSFDLKFTDEFIQASVKGLDPMVVNQLAAGQFSPETHLDLHGLNASQAYETLLPYIKRCYHHGKRCVLIIPGRGKNSPEGFGVLREKIQTWLTQAPFKHVVLAFTTAQQQHGGAGALYVLLRRFRKDGKIRWDRSPSDPDLY